MNSAKPIIVLFVLPVENEFKVNDDVIDTTAINNGWSDWKGVVVGIDGTLVKVKYTSGTERWKKCINLKHAEKFAFKCTLKPNDSFANSPYDIPGLLDVTCSPVLVTMAEDETTPATATFYTEKGYVEACRILPRAGMDISLDEKI